MDRVKNCLLVLLVSSLLGLIGAVTKNEFITVLGISGLLLVWSMLVILLILYMEGYD